MPDAADSFDAFRHLSAPNAAEYRRVLQAFSAAREAGWLLLRPAEVAEQAGPREASLSEDATVALLTQLSAWGNLERSADRARARSIEEFQRVGCLYSLSAQGLACEQADVGSSSLASGVVQTVIEVAGPVGCHGDF